MAPTTQDKFKVTDANDVDLAFTYANGTFTLTNGAVISGQIKVSYAYQVTEATLANEDLVKEKSDIIDGKNVTTKWIVNSATVKAWNDDPKQSGGNDDPATAEVEYDAPRITVSKAISTIKRRGTTYSAEAKNLPEKAQVGDEIVWTIEVGNTSKVEATGLKLTDTPAVAGSYTPTFTAVDKATNAAIENFNSTDFSLNAGQTIIITTSAYEVVEADKTNGIKNKAVVGDEESETPKLPVEILKITGQTKTWVKHETDVPTDVKDKIPADVKIAYAEAGKDSIIVSADQDNVTLLYKITINGDEGASFTLTEEKDATLIDADTDGKIEGVIPDSGEVSYYAYRTFERDADGNFSDISNKATVEAKPGTEPDPTDPPEAVNYAVTVKYITDEESIEDTSVLGKDDYTVIVPAGGAYDVSSETIIPKKIDVVDGEKTVQYVYDTYVSSAAGLADDDVDPMGAESAGLSGKANSDIIIVAVYSKDVVDKDDPYNPGPDDIADKYEVEVFFKAVNGYFGETGDASKTNEVKKIVVLTDAEDNKSVDGAAKVQPKQPAAGNLPKLGFKFEGTWSPVITEETVVHKADSVEQRTFTFTFTYAAEDTAPYQVVYYFVDAKGNELAKEAAQAIVTNRKLTTGGEGVVGTFVEISVPDEISDADHYVLEGVYGATHSAETNYRFVMNKELSQNTIHVYYDLDNWNDEKDTETGGDKIPDKYQVLVKFQSAANGSVNVDGNKLIQVFTDTDKNEIEFKPDTVKTQADEGYAFDIWTQDEGKTAVNPFRTQAAPGGTEITYTAHFDVDVKGTDPENPDKPGDNIPDKYQAVVRFESADPDMGSVTAEDQVFTFVDGEGNYFTSGDVTPVLGDAVKVAPVPENQFAYWMKDDGSDAVDPTTKLENVKGDTVITFYAHFAAIGPDPDPTATLTGTGRTWVYDGQPHGTTATVSGVEGYVIEYSVPGGNWTTTAPTVTNVSKGTVTVSVRATKPGYETLETSYTIAITPRPVTITTPSGSKTYDGTALTAGPATIDGLVNGETATVTATGSQTAVGSSSNEYSITWGTADASNYEVRRNLGTLTVSTATEPPVIPPVTPPVIIPDPPTPLGPGPDTGTTIEDEEVPLANAVGLNDTDHFAYIIGYENDTVRPLNNITRAEAVTIFFRLMTDEYRAANWSTENSFSDVSVGNWYNNAVSTVQKAGALEHFVPDGKFLPNQAITRAEFASIAAGFVSEEITGENVGDFSDTEGHWAALAIRKAVEAGWINGVGGNRFAPDETITRAEVMTMINRMLDRVPDAEHMLTDMKKWSDNPEDAWYYEAVQEATNDHDYERDEMGIVETWTALKATRDWKALEEEWAANGGSLAPAEPAEPVEGEGETGAEADADASDAEEQ